MDIKIGKVTWDDDAPEAFKERRKNKWPLKEVLGFSILGYMVCHQVLIIISTIIIISDWKPLTYM